MLQPLARTPATAKKLSRRHATTEREREYRAESMERIALDSGPEKVVD
jgi:hypothetical protein